MKKTLIYATALILATAALLPANYASANDNDGNFPHVDGNSQFPQTRWQNVRHTFRVHIPKNSQGVTQLSIEVPKTVRWSNNVNDVVVTKENDRKVKTNLSVNDRTISLVFAESIAPNTQLEIDLKNVQQPFRGNGPVYRLFAKFAGSSVEMPVGVARFRIN
ncbi:DUF2808 domain-containing protein [Iningainema tapete]|uniref:DUF2808 domain-containing protein n=1 Tax=Iningainema tapete BLCC-T55 TaxID=2748662 RepID=A0A8J6XH72_9CYAN|nr:DUF2808 domain-containing protein [Iningainema tapete]MBD2772076.1 DUF2808 domain-containing protein [Iningainema tapete BLCC-T55]